MNLHLTDWLLITAASWSILAIAVAVPLGKAMARADRTQVAVYPPPVPPVKPRETDEGWLSIWPEEIDEEAAMNREFEFMIVSEYGEDAL